MKFLHMWSIQEDWKLWVTTKLLPFSVINQQWSQLVLKTNFDTFKLQLQFSTKEWKFKTWLINIWGHPSPQNHLPSRLAIFNHEHRNDKSPRKVLKQLSLVNINGNFGSKLPKHKGAWIYYMKKRMKLLIFHFISTN